MNLHFFIDFNFPSILNELFLIPSKFKAHSSLPKAHYSRFTAHMIATITIAMSIACRLPHAL